MSEILPCLLLPLPSGKIVLPTSAVAEIIPYEKPETIPDIPVWLLGILTWRGIHIPLVGLEKMEAFLSWNKNTEEEVPDKTDSYSIAILNRIDKKISNNLDDSSHQYPFFSILLKGVPKLYRVAKDGIKLVAEQPEGNKRFILEARVQNDNACIPNLPYLWDIIDGLPSRLQWFRQIVL
jgi:chemosensory pili system protein ChpC